jgi:hypothetical protein
MGNKQNRLTTIMVHSRINSTKVIVNVPAITQANILHSSVCYITDGQRNSKASSNLNNTV